MSKRTKLKAEKLFAETQKKKDQAANQQEEKQKERAEHTARLKALRLAKTSEEEAIAKASKKPKKGK